MIFQYLSAPFGGCIPILYYWRIAAIKVYMIFIKTVGYQTKNQKKVNFLLLIKLRINYYRASVFLLNTPTAILRDSRFYLHGIVINVSVMI